MGAEPVEDPGRDDQLAVFPQDQQPVAGFGLILDNIRSSLPPDETRLTERSRQIGDPVIADLRIVRVCANEEFAVCDLDMGDSRFELVGCRGINSQTSKPGTLVRIGLNSPRYSIGASGFISYMSM